MADEVSLRDYVEEKFRATDKAVEAALTAQKEATAAALAAADRAVQKAESAANDRFAAVNEFRATLQDQTRTFVTREVFEALAARLDELRTTMSEQRGAKKGLSEGWGVLLAAGGFIFGLVAMVILIINQFK